MENITLPKIEIENLTQNYGRFSIGPLEKGFGITIGNALRRVLLSALSGAAVTSIKIDGVHHEFSSIEGAKEDTIEFILNVKQLRLRMDGEDSIRLTIDRRGEGPVLARDLEVPAGVEIVNPDLRLLTLDADDSHVSVELTVQKGKGYSSAEERSKPPIGEIPVDAIFSPVRKVNYTVKPERIGQLASLNRLELEVWTDGTIRPLEAVTNASRILAEHFRIIARLREEDLLPPEAPDTQRETDGREMLIDELGLSVRAYNCLKRAGITRVGEVLDRLAKGEDEIMSIRNFGRKSLIELKERLQQHGFLSEEVPTSESATETGDEGEEE